MRAHEFILLEYNRDITAKNYGVKLVARGEDNNVAQILSQLESGDPTPTNQYTEWIVRKYIQGDFLLEDISIVHRYLEKFIEASKKNLLDIRDLNRYKTLSDLKKTINSIYRSDSKSSESGLYPVLPDTKVYYNGPEGQFVTPLTLKASMDLQKIGSPAEWCTADSRAPTYYPSYSKQGPLYIWIDKSGKKFQFHFGSNQFKNIDDSDITLDMLDYFFVDFPITSVVLEPIAKKHFLELVKKVGLELVYSVPEKLKTYEMCLIAVKSDADLLEYLPEESKTYELCLEAVKNKGLALRYVPKELKTYELCLEAIKSNGLALGYVPEKFKTYELCLEAVKNDGLVLVYVPTELKTYELYLEAVRSNGYALQHVPEKLKTYELCLEAVKRHGYALYYVPEKFKTYELCLEAVRKEPHMVLGFVPEEFRAKIKQELGL